MSATDHGPRTTDKLERALGPWVATAIVVGTVIGSGVFKKPSVVAADVPTFGIAILAWVLLGLVIICGGLALAEVTILYPRAGGNYVFLREAYGRAFGFMWGWMDFCVIRTASIAALAMIFVESLHDMLRQLSGSSDRVFTDWQLHALAQGTILALGLVNARGVRWGGGLQFALTIIKVSGVIVMMLLPFGIVRLIEGAPTPTTENLKPFWPTAERPFGWNELIKFGGVLIAVLWPYHGWQNLGPVAGEIKHPQRNVPIALLGGIGIIMLLYVSLNVAFASVIPLEEMAQIKGQSVAVYFCGKLLGPIGGAVAAGVVMCSVFGALNGNILVGPRLLYAMGEDRLAPAGLSAVHPRYKTPARAIMTYTVWSMIVLLGGTIAAKEMSARGRTIDPFDALTDFAMYGVVIFETLVVAAVYVFRRKEPNAERPYRCLGYPIVPAIYVIFFIFVLASYFTNEDKIRQAVTGTAFVLAGAAVYGLFLRGRNS